MLNILKVYETRFAFTKAKDIFITLEEMTSHFEEHLIEDHSAKNALIDQICEYMQGLKTPS